MHPWPPDPAFLKFLDAIEATAGEDLPKNVWVMFMEIRAGSAQGRMFYEQTMNDEQMRIIYEAWKDLQD